MDITSLGFLIFLIIAIPLYYRVSESKKPWMLIALSFFFIGTYDLRGILFLMATAAVIWQAGLRLQKVRQDGRDAAAAKSAGRRIMVLSVALVASVLILLKYLGPMVLRAAAPSVAVKLFLPIGLSYYTLMAISYVVDVYWGRIQAEGQYHRLLLFLCYFPQILQGPIGRYQDLSAELYEKDHSFRLHNIKFGVQLILWGYFKLLVVGDKTHYFVTNAFYSGSTAYGFTVVLCLIMFGFDLYANFSGGIDVIRGVSQCFGIELSQNFRQPFFSRSLGDFWRRWHISLGAWMKDYIFFPLSMSKPFSRVKKALKPRFGRKMATRIPMAAANIFVFLLVGLWHGLGTNYLLWGLYNGLILAFSEIMADYYVKAKDRLSIRTESRAWYAFSLLRTFLIITLGWATDCADTAAGSFAILGNMLRFSQTNLEILHSTTFGYAKAIFSIAVLLAVEILHEKGKSVREIMDRKPTILQFLFWAALIQLIACFGHAATLGGLMYAGF